MLNMDGSVNGDSYGIGRKPGIRKEGREDGEGNTGTPGQGGIKQPLGDAVLPLLLMALAFMAYVAAHDRRQAGEFKIPTALDELLESSGYRYGLLLFADGVSRDVGDYIGKTALGVGLAIVTAVLTMGMVSVYTYPTPAVSLMYAAVLDSQTDRIVFYNLREYEDLNTTSEKSVRRQLSRLLKDFRK